MQQGHKGACQCMSKLGTSYVHVLSALSAVGVVTDLVQWLDQLPTITQQSP